VRRASQPRPQAGSGPPTPESINNSPASSSARSAEELRLLRAANQIAPLWGLWQPAAFALAGAIVVILVALETWKPWRDDMGNDVDGDIKPTTAIAPRNIHAVPAE
jgi:hypothetical protein